MAFEPGIATPRGSSVTLEAWDGIALRRRYRNNISMSIAYRINSLAQGPPPVFRLHQLGAMSRPEAYLKLIRSHRRGLLRATLVIQCRRERLELDGSPSAEETLALTIQERRLESSMRRLNEDGVVVLKDREMQLSRHDQTLNEKYRHEEDWEEERRRYRLTEDMQETASRWRAASSASAGTGAAPGAGEAAAPGAGEAASAGAGEAASAGSRRRSRSRSMSMASSVQVDGQRPRRWRQQRPITPPRQQVESSASWSSPVPERAAEARLPPRMAPVKVLAPTPTVKPRKPAPSTIWPMRMLLPIPSTIPPVRLKEGAWVRVKRGWLTGRAEPTSQEELESWGADVVLSLHDRSAGRGNANRIIVAAAASASGLVHRVYPIVNPISRHAHINALECKELSEVVWWSDFYLEQRLKVLLHCRHGHHRTGVAIYLLLRSILEEPAQCLSLMQEMRPAMHTAILRQTRNRHLFSKAETIFASPEFRAGVSCMRRWAFIESRRASSCGCISHDV